MLDYRVNKKIDIFLKYTYFIQDNQICCIKYEKKT